MERKKKKQAEGIDPELMRLHGSTQPVTGIKFNTSSEQKEVKEYYEALKRLQQAARDKGLTK